MPIKINDAKIEVHSESTNNPNITIGTIQNDKFNPSIHIDNKNLIFQSENTCVNEHFQTKNSKSSIKFPPLGLLSSNSKCIKNDDHPFSNGDYQANASSGDAFKAFNFDFEERSQYWLTSSEDVYNIKGSYVGSSNILKTSQYKGSWIQLKLPKPCKLKSYVIETTDTVVPISWLILGKQNDSQEWFKIDEIHDLKNLENCNHFSVEKKQNFFFDIFVYVLLKVRLKGESFMYPSNKLLSTKYDVTNSPYGFGTYKTKSSYTGYIGRHVDNIAQVFIDNQLSIRNFNNDQVEIDGFMGHWICLELPDIVNCISYNISFWYKQPALNPIEWLLHGYDGNKWILLDHQKNLNGTEKDMYGLFHINKEKQSFQVKELRLHIVKGHNPEQIEHLGIKVYKLYFKCRPVKGFIRPAFKKIQYFGNIEQSPHGLQVHDNKMYITNDYIGIGTQNPVCNLDVRGKIQGDEIISKNVRLKDCIMQNKNMILGIQYILPEGKTKEDVSKSLLQKLNEYDEDGNNEEIKYVRIQPGQYYLNNFERITTTLSKNDTIYDFTGVCIKISAEWLTNDTNDISIIQILGNNVTIIGLRLEIDERTYPNPNRKRFSLTGSLINYAYNIRFDKCYISLPTNVSPYPLEAGFYHKNGAFLGKVSAINIFRKYWDNRKNGITFKFCNSTIKAGTFNSHLGAKEMHKYYIIDNCHLEGQNISTDDIIDNIGYNETGIPRNDARYIVPTDDAPLSPKKNQVAICKNTTGFDKDSSGSGVYVYEEELSEWKFKFPYDHSEGNFNTKGEVYVIDPHPHKHRGTAYRVIPRGYIITTAESCLRSSYSRTPYFGSTNVTISNSTISRFRGGTTTHWGGGLHEGSSLSIINCTYIDQSNQHLALFAPNTTLQNVMLSSFVRRHALLIRQNNARVHGNVTIFSPNIKNKQYNNYSQITDKNGNTLNDRLIKDKYLHYLPELYDDIEIEGLVNIRSNGNDLRIHIDSEYMLEKRALYLYRNNNRISVNVRTKEKENMRFYINGGNNTIICNKKVDVYLKELQDDYRFPRKYNQIKACNLYFENSVTSFFPLSIEHAFFTQESNQRLQKIFDTMYQSNKDAYYILNGQRYPLQIIHTPIAIRNMLIPEMNNSEGGFLYNENGALKWKGSNGSITTIAPS